MRSTCADQLDDSRPSIGHTRPESNELFGGKSRSVDWMVTKSACYTTVDSLGLPFINDQVVTASKFQKCGNV